MISVENLYHDYAGKGQFAVKTGRGTGTCPCKYLFNFAV